MARSARCCIRFPDWRLRRHCRQTVRLYCHHRSTACVRVRSRAFDRTTGEARRVALGIGGDLSASKTTGALSAAETAAPSGPAGAADSRCAPGQQPQFRFGFADLKAQVGAATGEPATCEFADPNGSGDIHQATTTGLAFWRKSHNTRTFPNWWEHWGLTSDGLVTWTGSSVDGRGCLGAHRGVPSCT
jgi:hypothetical protein